MKHLGIIMDGNTRWASVRNLDAKVGYQEGAKAFTRLLKDFCLLPIDVITVYAFSTENFSRKKEEVSNILSVIASFLYNEVYDFCLKNKISVRFIGDIDSFNVFKEIKEKFLMINSADYKKTMVIAINYGGIDEVCRAYRKLAQQHILMPTKEDLFSALDTNGLPMVDTVIRYGSYNRLSNFLPLQSAYAELFFLEKFWPDYDKKDVEDVLNRFNTIKRNFGGRND